MNPSTANKLHQKLEQYEQQLQKFEAEFLANDGKIDEEEQAILDAIRKNIQAVKDKLPAPTTNQAPTLPVAFSKGLAAVTAAITNLETKIEQLIQTGKLASVQKKVQQKIQTLEANFSKLEKALSDCSPELMEKGKTQLANAQAQLDNLKTKGSDTANAPVASKFESVGAMLQSYSQLLADFTNNSYLKGLFSN